MVLFIAVFWLKCAFVKPSVGPLPTAIVREQGTFVRTWRENRRRWRTHIFRIRSGTSSGATKNGRIPAEKSAQRISVFRFDWPVLGILLFYLRADAEPAPI